MSGRVERYGSSVATKRYLFTPGPTPVPPEVLAAVGAPVLHHRSPDFLPVYERVLARLREVCQTDSDVLLFGASGTGSYHGKWGFDTFSKLKPVFYRSKFNRLSDLYPPYGAKIARLEKLLRFLS